MELVMPSTVSNTGTGTSISTEQQSGIACYLPSIPLPLFKTLIANLESESIVYPDDADLDLYGNSYNYNNNHYHSENDETTVRADKLIKKNIALTEIDQYVDYYAECLGMDVINLNGVLGYNLGSGMCNTTAQPKNSVRFDLNLILTLLNSGLEYVASSSSGKLMSMLHMNRAVLILNKNTKALFSNHMNNYLSSDNNTFNNMNPSVNTNTNHSLLNGSCTSTVTSILPPSLEKRRKDMPRIFRNKLKPEDKLSLKLNTDFDLALSKLRGHHGSDCWIGTALEYVWR